jgi:ADP-heptose:LPS heptosyltransferase
MESRDDSLELWLTEAETDKAAQVLNFDNDKCHHFIALCPTASHRRKVWPEERFAQLIDWMLGSIDCHIVLLGSQHNGLSLQSIRQKYPSGVLDLTEKTTVREAAAILARCSMYVGLDTGPMHLAVASKVPVVSISCHPSSANDINPMSFRRFGPWGVPSRIIQPEFALDECAETDDGCQRRDESHCIAQIGIERVKEAIKELIRVLPDENGLQLKKEGFVIE